MTSSASKQSLDSWDANADYWDRGVGQDGNKYWKVLQLPCLRRLIDVETGSNALELATGNGLGARWLAAEGATVLATDGSPRMLENARARTSGEAYKDRITFRQLDATDPDALAALTETNKSFDVILLNMAIMDIPTLEPMASAALNLLKKDGIFVATMLHPVFFTSRAWRNVEIRNDTASGLEVVRTRVIRDYLSVPPWPGVAQYGQPEPQLYYHRPLHELFMPFFKAGLIMDALEEPAFTDEHGIEERLEATSNFTQIPPILAFRFRRVQ